MGCVPWVRRSNPWVLLMFGYHRPCTLIILFFIYIFSLLFLHWAYSWEGYLTTTLNSVVAGILGAANLLSIASTVTRILQAVLFPIYSKLSDMIGRAEAFTVAAVIYSVSSIIQATANNYGTFVVCYKLHQICTDYWDIHVRAAE